MPGGGLMHLVAYGAQNVDLTQSPNITFWRVVNRRAGNLQLVSNNLVSRTEICYRLKHMKNRKGKYITVKQCYRTKIRINNGINYNNYTLKYRTSVRTSYRKVLRERTRKVLNTIDEIFDTFQKTDLDGLKTQLNYTHNNDDNYEEENLMCCICFENYDTTDSEDNSDENDENDENDEYDINNKNRITILPCNHHNHTECLSKWLCKNRNDNCPYCRTSIRIDANAYKEETYNVYVEEPFEEVYTEQFKEYYQGEWSEEYQEDYYVDPLGREYTSEDVEQFYKNVVENTNKNSKNGGDGNFNQKVDSYKQNRQQNKQLNKQQNKQQQNRNRYR